MGHYPRWVLPRISTEHWPLARPEEEHLHCELPACLRDRCSWLASWWDLESSQTQTFGHVWECLAKVSRGYKTRPLHGGAVPPARSWIKRKMGAGLQQLSFSTSGLLTTGQWQLPLALAASGIGRLWRWLPLALAAIFASSTLTKL